MILHRRPPHPPRLLFLIALMSPSVIAGGCAVLGIAAQAVPEGDIRARYSGLAGHSVGVLVWAPRGIEIDFPTLRLDLTAGIQGRFQQAQKAGREELKTARFPHAPASLVRFQEDHPELEQAPIASVAPRLGVERLIYVEVDNFQTRSDQAVDLFRGSASASIKVVEVAPGGAEVAYEESGLTVTYPPSAPPEGMPGLGDARVYRGTAALLAQAVAERFYTHPSGK